MNVRLLSITDMNNSAKVPDDFYYSLDNFVGYVKEIELDKQMIIFDNNARSYAHKSSPIIDYCYDADNRIYTVKSLEYTYRLEVLDNGKKKKSKSNLYMLEPIGRRYWEDNPDKDKHLLADGKYRTKIYASDLPEWYIYGRLYKKFGFISAKGVKHLIYKPNYTVDNHLYKYDILFISYDKEIVPEIDTFGHQWYKDYNAVVDSSLIVDFVEAAEKYSNYNVSEIRKELKKKEAWYYERNNKK